VGMVLEVLPPDPTNLEDMIHVALFTGQPANALLHASQLDPWLAAHLADIMEPLSLIQEEPDECDRFLLSFVRNADIAVISDSSGLSLRDQYILAYAEYLHCDPALWQITVDYMYSCGDIGRQRADEGTLLFLLPSSIILTNSV
jgi:nuclear pore complex protein Nup85